MTDLKLGLCLPTIANLDNLRAAGGIGAAARHAEQLGFESVWVADFDMGDGTPALDSVMALGVAAEATERINLGFSVYVLPLHAPVRTAAEIASLQYVSGGRVLFGVGSGGFPRAPFWPALGVAPADRGRLTDEALDLLPSLVSGAPTETRGVTVTIAPAAKMPPVLIGGSAAPRTLDRVVKYDAEWFPSLVPHGVLADGVAKLRDLAGKEPMVTVGGHHIADRAYFDAFVRDLTSTFGIPPEEAPAVPIFGGPQEIAERLAGYAEAGAHRVALALDGDDWLRQAEQLAEGHALLR
ncbi:LLM class flavin-dependent oxidoreductase [Fodinicola acaciae]|uniref:LLM class flavin-dependent oxidoreductase n=1 Tax=Fodinicola acaciae TaxID=2681555 RepID=UPI0013D73E58|nr:LLM class flavin-dependent oxidoreductase [Fodinicola acaciae]